MFAGSLMLALALSADPAGKAAPPVVTMPQLDAYVAAGNYHLIRKEKIGHVLEGIGVVRVLTANGSYPILEFPGSHLSVALRGLTDENDGLKLGDRVKFRGMIVDEGYACLQVWTYEHAKVPAEAPPAPAAPIDVSHLLDCSAPPPAK